MSGSPRRLSTLDDAAHVANELRRSGRRIVLSNGTFDLLHVGHIRQLQEARTLGDVLILGVNSDRSVRSYKGSGRPVVPEDERAELLLGLRSVDYVVIFDQPTAEDLIRAVRPHVYAKGRDYDEATLPEAPLVRSLGGQVAFVGDIKSHAASELIQRIRALAP